MRVQAYLMHICCSDEAHLVVALLPALVSQPDVLLMAHHLLKAVPLHGTIGK